MSRSGPCVVLAIGAVCVLLAGLCQANETSIFSDAPSLEEVQRMIEEEGHCWQAGETSVSRLSEEEKGHLLGYVVPPERPHGGVGIRVELPLDLGDPPRSLPSAWDWRDHGGVTPVKSQGGCGSCWDFCATAAFESMILVYDNIEFDLSEQQVLSCNTHGSSCAGGWMDAAYDLFMSPGAVLEECMPYQANDQIPCTQYECEFVAHIDGYSYVANNIQTLKQVIYEMGPVAVAMAVLSSFQYYNGGCYQNDNPGSLNHGILLIGWDDSMCGGQGAWIGKNSWGTGWGDDGFFYIRYGDCQIGTGAEVIHYTPMGPRLEYVSFDIDDSSGNGDGVVDPGESIVLSVTVTNTGTATAQGVAATLLTSSDGITITDASATFPNVPSGEMISTSPPHFAFDVAPDVAPCDGVAFQLALTCDGGEWDKSFGLVVGQPQIAFFDDLEADGDWVVGAPDDDATSGIWVRSNPNATYDNLGQMVQPENDHTPYPGDRCFVTGNSFAGRPQDFKDVDGGKTTLFSRVFELSQYDGAIVKYFRWYTNDTGADPNTDEWVVDVTDDGWATHHNLETLGASERSWVEQVFYLTDFIDMTDQVQLRFVASDYAPDSIVEAGVDDFTLLVCGADDLEPPQVTVLSPNGGEAWAPLSQQEILWEATDNVGVDHIDIYLSTDGGQSYPDHIAAGEENDGSFDWLLPDLMTEQASIKVVAVDAALLEGSDESDDVFTIGPETGVAGEEIPRVLALHQSAPNPFHPHTTIVYDLPREAPVTLVIYDLAGREIRTLVDGVVEPGRHTASWDGRDESGARVGSGVYFYRLLTNGRVLGRKMVLVE